MAKRYTAKTIATLATATPTLCIVAVLCINIAISHSVGAVFNTDDVNPREYPNTSKSSDRTPTPSPTPSSSASPATSAQPEDSSVSPLPASAESENQTLSTWTPWVLGGSAVLVLILAGALVWRKAKK